MQLAVHLYRVPKGEVGFMAVPSSGATQHQVWAFPIDQTPAAVIANASLRRQLLPLLAANRVARVHVLRDVGSGGVTLSMSSNRVDYSILGARDGE
jgi:hypothetical protein